MTPIKYIGHRATYREGAYGSGIVFAHGQTVNVEDDVLANKLLRHKDVYVLGEEGNVAEFVSPKQDQSEDEDKLQQQRDSVALMDKEALESFAKTTFRVDIDRRKSVDNLRAQVIGLIDQYGVE